MGYNIRVFMLELVYQNSFSFSFSGDEDLGQVNKELLKREAP